MRTAQIEYQKRSLEISVFDAPDHISNLVISRETFYELDLLEATAQHYRKGSAILDVGAFIGNHSLYFAAVLNAYVVAIEPNPEAFRLLELNIRVNKLRRRVRCVNKAAAAEAGCVALIEGSKENVGQTKVLKSIDGNVAAIRLEDLRLRRRVSIIKVDVEGAEMDVLRGAERILATDKPQLFVEAVTDMARDELVEFLAPHGYQVYECYGFTPTYHFAVSTAG